MQPRLTHRGRQILDLIYKGHSDREIAGILIISVSTVRHHIEKMFSEFDVYSRTELVSKAIRSGLIQPARDS